MNKRRRNSLHVILDGLERLRDPVDKTTALSIIREAVEGVQKCADEEEAALDNRPESLRWSADNDAMSDNVQDLNEVASDLEIIFQLVDDMDVYSYELIRLQTVKAVNTIKGTIHR